MNLLNAINKRYLIISTSILISGGVVFFFILQYILDEQLNEQLFEEKAKLEEAFATSSKPPDSLYFPGLKVTEVNSIMNETLIDTVIFSEEEQELEPYRILLFSIKYDGRFYQVQTSKTLYEKSDLIITIFWLMISIMVLQFCFFWLASKYFNRRLFAPFLSTLSVMDNYSPGKTNKVELAPAGIKEFEKLNRTFENMHKRLLVEFRELKDFTENASHELQTPLSILQNNIDMLIQGKNMEASQIFMLDEMSNSVIRLSKMNKQLLILTKIENNQFSDIVPVFVNDCVALKAAVMKDFFDHRQLRLEINQISRVNISMNPVLADILLNNLFSNAIKYATPGSDIIISLESKTLEIKNAGQTKALDTNKIYSRFYKPDGDKESTGLGLAIVKQICDLYNFTINYQYVNTIHIFTIDFNDSRLN